MESLTDCPVCHQRHFTTLFSCEDQTVSHETFQLMYCPDCDFVITNPRPTQHQLPGYYQSTSYISHSNKTRNLVDLIYKVARVFTLKWKLHIIRQHSLEPPHSVLDFGCGTGDFLHTCKRNGLKISGVEPSQVAREQAIKETETQIHSDFSTITDKFDAITLWHVLEHVPDFHQTLEQVKEHLKDNGTIFVAVPNFKSYDAKTYGEHWAAYDVPRHLWHFSKRSMQKLLQQHQLKLIKTLPMKLDAFYVSMLSEKYRAAKGGVPKLVRALLQGWKSNRSARSTSEYSSLIYVIRK